MQLLQRENKLKGARRLRGGQTSSKGGGAGRHKAAAKNETICARQVLAIVPPVLRSIRKMMHGGNLSTLSVPQFRALVLMNINPQASLSCVAHQIGASLPAASRMIDTLVQRQFVTRTGCAHDRRRLSLELTPRGRAVLRQAYETTEAQLAQRLAALQPHQHAKVIDGLECLAEVFGSDGPQIERAREDANGAAPSRPSPNRNGNHR